MKFTIPGGNGFVGSYLKKICLIDGYQVEVPERDADPRHYSNAGHIVYCIGLTGDFRERPFETVDAHVKKLGEWLKYSVSDSFLYLSSTRIYQGLPETATAGEDTKICLQPSSDSLYDISKLLGEALCISTRRPNVRIARLSNVFGSGMPDTTFLGSLFNEYRRMGSILIREDPSSSKDYILIDDVARLLLAIALGGVHKTYNVASGYNTTHQEIATVISKELNCEVNFLPNAPRRIFPRLDNSRIRADFGFSAKNTIEELSSLIEFKNGMNRSLGS